MEHIIIAVARWLTGACHLTAEIGCLYALVGAVLVRRFVRPPLTHTKHGPAVTILKPLHGSEPELYANLASFCAQDYAGPVQIVLGVQDPGDPAIAIARRLMADFPDRDIDLVIDPRRHGGNCKISNIINMTARIRHGIVVLSDSDIRVEADYLRTVVGTLGEPGVGLVTCAYRGQPAFGLWGRLAANAINHHFLPSVLVGVAVGRARPCFGSTIALTTETLARIGGFTAFAEQLADDYAMGEAVRALGLRVVISPYVVTHLCPEKRARDLVRQELRWARTIRLVDPFGFAGSVVTHALPFALIGVLASSFSVFSLGLLAAALACRWYLQHEADRALRLSPSPVWLGPARDLLSFAIFVASFFGRVVSWRGQRFDVRADGTLVYAGDIRS